MVQVSDIGKRKLVNSKKIEKKELNGTKERTIELETLGCQFQMVFVLIKNYSSRD